MNYEKIILELMTRIQVLEEKVEKQEELDDEFYTKKKVMYPIK